MFKKYVAYVRDNPNGYWFKSKLYGWGWTPATKEGWFITIVFVALIIDFALTIDENSPPQEVMFTFVIPVAILTGAFIRIAYTKGEKPHWQWGVPKK